MTGPERSSAPEATLGAFGEFTRQTLVPILLYKSIFVGEWFSEMVSHHAERGTREALTRMGQATLREAIEVVASMRDWDAGQGSAESREAFVSALQRRMLLDLMRLKEGNTEALVLAAMRAPTAPVRDRLLYLADLDRQHADGLRTLLGADRVGEALERTGGDARPVGAQSGRGDAATLGANVRAQRDAIVANGDRPVRLVLSQAAMRHLRDEGGVSPSGTVFDLPVDVDFGWEGECFAVHTDARVSLAEILTYSRAPRAGGDLLGE